jgi:hypothetical protein
VLVLALAALALPAHALAAAWVGAATVTENPVDATALPVPQLAVDGQGNAVLAMAAGKGPPKQVEVATRPAGGAWSSVQLLGPVATNGGPSIAVDPAGNAIVAFVATTVATAPCASGTGCLEIWSKPAGSSSFTRQDLLSAPTATSFFEPSVALDPRGTGNAAIVWWTTPSAGQSVVQAVQRSGGAWSTVQNASGTSTTDSFSDTNVAIDAAGDVVALYAALSPQGCSAGCSYTLRTATYNGRGWGRTTVEPTTTTARFDQKVIESVDGQGNASAVWFSVNTVTSVQTIRVATHPQATTAAWGPVATVHASDATNTLSSPLLAIGPDGEAVVTWGEITDSGTASIVASARPPGGSFSSPQTIDPDTGNGGAGPALAMDGAGNATAVWHNTTAGKQRFATRPHGGTFGAVADVTSGGSTTVVADSDPAGNVSVAWPASSSTVQTEVYDPVPPTLDTFTAPLGAVVGASLPFSDSASDVWSPPATLSWDFGDGTIATGDTLSHTYSSSGSMLAKVTATDASGNSTAQSQSVDVSVASPPPPAGLPDPVAGKTFNVQPVGSGPVLVKVPGSKVFVPLTKPSQIQDGAIIDARHGRVRITIDNGHGGFDTADFYGGMFKFEQPAVKPGQTAFANLYLFGGSFKGCPKAPRHPKIASAAKKRKKGPVRRLWGSGKGSFRTVGRFSSATVRGTTWLTADECGGTLTRVASGKVAVRDFVRTKTIVLTKGKKYLAAPTR